MPAGGSLSPPAEVLPHAVPDAGIIAREDPEAEPPKVEGSEDGVPLDHVLVSLCLDMRAVGSDTRPERAIPAGLLYPASVFPDRRPCLVAVQSKAMMASAYTHSRQGRRLSSARLVS